MPCDVANPYLVLGTMAVIAGLATLAGVSLLATGSGSAHPAAGGSLRARVEPILSRVRPRSRVVGLVLLGAGLALVTVQASGPLGCAPTPRILERSTTVAPAGLTARRSGRSVRVTDGSWPTRHPVTVAICRSAGAPLGRRSIAEIGRWFVPNCAITRTADAIADARGRIDVRLGLPAPVAGGPPVCARAGSCVAFAFDSRHFVTVHLATLTP